MSACINWLRDLRQDLVFALRMLRKSPAFAVVAATSLALGIGANTAIFGMFNALWRPLPVRAPDQLVVLAADTKGDETGLQSRYSFPALQDLRRQSNLFSDVFAYGVQIRGFNDGARTMQFFFSYVTGNYFSALGLKPALGRLFQPGEGEDAGAPLAIVLGYEFWMKRLGGDPHVIGRQVRLDGQAATIIGVAAEGYHGLYAEAEMDGYLTLRSLIWDDNPRSSQIFFNRMVRPLSVFARLKPDIGLAQARTAMGIVARHIEQEHPDTDQGIGIRVVPELLSRPIPLRAAETWLPLIRVLLLLLAGLVLLLACMNVANILLVRATVRRRELAIRAALGSGRARLVRQMLTESLVLALAGTVSGMILGQWCCQKFFGSLKLATELPFRLDVSFDWRVFAYSLSAAVFTGLFIGVWPAFQASRTEPGAALHDGGRANSGGPGRRRVRDLLVIGQVAGSLVLLIAAGLFVRSLRSIHQIDIGFAPDHLLNARLSPHWAGYGKTRTQSFYRELERRIRAWPEVRSASLAFSTPMGYYGAGMTVYPEGQIPDPGRQPPAIACNYVDPAYFDTMQIPILRGRAFRESDDEMAPRVAIVNQTMAERFWPNRDPIGQRFHADGPDGPLTEVVGVARNGKYLAVFEGTLPYFYVPDAQYFGWYRVLQLRTTVPPELLSGRLQREVRSLDPNVPITDLQTMTDLLNGPAGFLMFHIGTWQAGAMGILGLVLALVGVYGVVSYGAAQRTREIGIRMALGAAPRMILSIILRQGIGLVLSGVAVGLTGALALSRLLTRVLINVSAVDPLVLVAVPLLLALVALCACYLPAHRAMRVSPMDALRHE